LACIELAAKQGANREALAAKREEERAAWDRYRRDGGGASCDDGEPASSGEAHGALGGEWLDFVDDEDEARRRRQREEWEASERQREEEAAVEAEERKQRRQRKRERRSARAQRDDDDGAEDNFAGGGGKRAKTRSASSLPRGARDAARAAPAPQRACAALPARSRFARAAAVATTAAAPLAALDDDNFDAVDAVDARSGARPSDHAPAELRWVAPSPATKKAPVAEDDVGGEWADFM
jgi:hypothetical protein